MKLDQWVDGRDMFSLVMDRTGKITTRVPYYENNEAHLYMGVSDSSQHEKYEFRKSRNDHIQSWIGSPSYGNHVILQLEDGSLSYCGATASVETVMSRLTTRVSLPRYFLDKTRRRPAKYNSRVYAEACVSIVSAAYRFGFETEENYLIAMMEME